MDPTFAATTSPVGLRIADPILHREYTLRTESAVEPRPRSTDGFYYPVDAAVSVMTRDLVLPTTVATFVRTPAGEMVDEISHNHVEQFSERSYLVELMTPIKVMLRFESAFEVATADDHMAFMFPDEIRVGVGARSYHDQPAGTITTTDDLDDLRTAIEALSSSLKTTSCERSWPTLRGHPPRIEAGDHLHIPEGFASPETGVTITTPDDRAALYAVAPLAFYLGADIQHGSDLRLQTDGGLDHALSYRETFGDDPGPTEEPPREVGRLLKHVVTLDCLTRTEGYYQVDLHERQQFEREYEGDVSLDFPALYDQPLAEQLSTYLSVPYAAVEPVMPTWRLVADVTADTQSAELLPYIVNDLGIVRVATSEADQQADSPKSPEISDFARGASDVHQTDTLSDTDRFSRGLPTPNGADGPLAYVTPPDADALEQAWAGPGRPFGAGKLLREGFEHKEEHIESRTPDESEIEIAVVCNDAAMTDEYADRNLYGDRDEVRYDVTEHRDLSVAKFRGVLESDLDFVHYIGHIEDGAFVCTDGYFDPAALDAVGVSAFLLNGCRSYRAGLELVRAGSVGGIVTHSDVGNSAAVEIGRVTARLLNIGYSLRSALVVAKDQRLVGNQYLVVGDGGTSVLQSVSGTPYLCEITEQSEDEYELTIQTHPTVGNGIGSIFRPHLHDVSQYYLSGGRIDEFDVTQTELLQFLRLQEAPIRHGGTFDWASEQNRFDN